MAEIILFSDIGFRLCYKIWVALALGSRLSYWKIHFPPSHSAFTVFSRFSSGIYLCFVVLIVTSTFTSLLGPPADKHTPSMLSPTDFMMVVVPFWECLDCDIYKRYLSMMTKNLVLISSDHRASFYFVIDISCSFRQTLAKMV